MEIKKNDCFNVDIIDIGSNGEGIAKINNFTLFIQGALLNEKVSIKILKINKNFGFAKLIEILEKSPYRRNPPCEYYGNCGGCNIMHLDYDEQLKIKSNQIENNLKKIAKLTNFENVSKTLGMQNPYFYRNKASFPISFDINTNSLNIGFYKPRSHNIVNIDKCIIQHPINDIIIKKMRNFIINSGISIYDETKNRGILRHIMTRVNKGGKVILCLVINSNSFKYKNELVNEFSDLKSVENIVINYNTNKNNIILGDKIELLHGNDYLIDTIKDINFKISPLSFYQVNNSQTEVLYETILNFCDLTGNEIVVDAYCGIGSISLFLARNSKKVYGVEVVENAIQNANENKTLNNISNAEFILGKSEEVIPNLLERDIKPDVIVVDPPRKGCDKILLDCIKKSGAKKLIYVSCDNATMSRDILYIKEHYELQNIQPVDMFCHSTHIEVVAELIKRS